MEVVGDLAYPLPASVIAEMLGMPAEDRDQLQVWSRDIVAVFQVADLDQFHRAQNAVVGMQEYLRPLLEQRRRDPRDDVLSVLAAAERDGLVTETEILANAVLLLFAGHETTARLIGKGLAMLFQHPDQLARLKATPDLIPSAVEEMLRHDGPVDVLVRVATEPVEVAGRSFPTHTQFYLAVLAGNRDPEVFDDPDRFDVTRTPNRHTAFGLGTYYCLGAALARMETHECLQILLERFPDLRQDPGGPVWRPVLPFAQELQELPVELG
jgi:cytochrome P450